MTPFGNGVLCVNASGGLVRSAVGRIDSAGSFAYELDCVTPRLGAELMAGTH